MNGIEVPDVINEALAKHQKYLNSMHYMAGYIDAILAAPMHTQNNIVAEHLVKVLSIIRAEIARCNVGAE